MAIPFLFLYLSVYVFGFVTRNPFRITRSIRFGSGGTVERLGGLILQRLLPLCANRSERLKDTESIHCCWTVWIRPKKKTVLHGGTPGERCTSTSYNLVGVGCLEDISRYWRSYQNQKMLQMFKRCGICSLHLYVLRCLA